MTNGDHTVSQTPATRGRALLQLGLEMIIGVIIATILIIVGWASSNAIRFVYGGY